MITNINDFKKSMNENKEVLTIPGLFTMFSEINSDKHTQNVVPFSDEEYYADQIMNIYDDVTEEQAMQLAKELHEYSENLGYAKHDGSFGGDDSEIDDKNYHILLEHLYFDINLITSLIDEGYLKNDLSIPEKLNFDDINDFITNDISYTEFQNITEFNTFINKYKTIVNTLQKNKLI